MIAVATEIPGRPHFSVVKLFRRIEIIDYNKIYFFLNCNEQFFLFSTALYTHLGNFLPFSS